MIASPFASKIAVLAVVGGLCASLVQTPAQQHEAQLTAQEASKMFAERCVNCHVAPDIAFATDRAWVAQVSETA
jgi:mono/diheme cytochrome c family protein